MFLLDSGKFAADPEGSAQRVLDILEKAGATIVAHRVWQEGKLAYLIEGQRKAVNYLTYFRMDSQGLTGFARASKLNDLILRHLVVKLPTALFDRMAELIGDGSSTDDDASEGSSEKATDAAPKVDSGSEEENSEEKSSEITSEVS